MARFLQASDYEMQIRTEIRHLLDGYDPANPDDVPLRLLRAENTAISQIKKWLAGRYDCSAIFIPPADPDERDQFIVTITIDLTLYHLYSQTGSRDVPEHRKHRYQDALDWLKDAGQGLVTSDLPSLVTTDPDDNSGDIKLWSYPPENHRW
jgi:hypothetical protein